MSLRNGLLSTLLVCLAPAFALAHGGSYRGPGAGVGGGGGGGGQVPPGTADDPSASLTRWESWWAQNKEYYLQLHANLRHDKKADGARTPSARDAPGGDGPTEEEIRATRDADVREAVVPIFLDALRDRHFEPRTAAAIALGKTLDPRGLKPLQKAALGDKHKDVRDAAVLGLGLLGNEGAVPFLDKMLNDRNENTRKRAFAAFSLGMIGGDDAGASLMRFLDPKQGPRHVGGARRQNDLMASLFVAIGLADHPDAPAVLRDALTWKEFDDGVKAFIVLSLGRVGDRESLPTIIKLIKREKDFGMRRSAVIALGKIAKESDEEAIDILVKTAHADKDIVARHFAAVALGGLAYGPELRARLRTMLAKGDGLDRPFFALALGIAKDTGAAKQIRELMAKDKLDSNRAGYCIALGLMGAEDAAADIEGLLQYRGNVWLQSYAALSLGMLGHKESTGLLRKRLAEHNDPRLKMNFGVALGLLHDPKAKEFFIETLRGDGTVYERGAAAMSMGVLRINEALPHLIAVYRGKDEQDMVRAYAVVALGVLADPSPTPKLSRFAIDNNYSIGVDPLGEVLSIL